tara:strand:- start:25 stop:312 length:288 start_codon:yes stop_codon:yes gene_type:complete
MFYNLEAEQILLKGYCKKNGSLKDKESMLMYNIIKAHQKVGDGYYKEAIQTLIWTATNIPYFIKKEKHQFTPLSYHLEDCDFTKNIVKQLKETED